MKNLPRFLLVTATFGLATIAAAQPPDGPRGPGRRGPGGPGGPGGRGPGHPIVRVLDANHDGVLSKAELDNASVALRTLDANRDTSVTTDELRPPRPTNAPNRPERPADAPPRKDGERQRPVDPIMLALDASADGALSATEITNATASLNALDANKDGQLTRDEFHPLPPVR